MSIWGFTFVPVIPFRVFLRDQNRERIFFSDRAGFDCTLHFIISSTTVLKKSLTNSHGASKAATMPPAPPLVHPRRQWPLTLSAVVASSVTFPIQASLNRRSPTDNRPLLLPPPLPPLPWAIIPWYPSQRPPTKSPVIDPKFNWGVSNTRGSLVENLVYINNLMKKKYIYVDL